MFRRFFRQLASRLVAPASELHLMIDAPFPLCATEHQPPVGAAISLIVDELITTTQLDSQVVASPIRVTQHRGKTSLEVEIPLLTEDGIVLMAVLDRLQARYGTQCCAHIHLPTEPEPTPR